MLPESWSALARVVAVGVPAYLALVLLLRISGKRTLSKMNAFDFIITIAFGSALATVMLSSEVSLAEGVAAFALLVLLQFAITWSSARWSRVERLVKSEPRLLFFEGRFLEGALRAERFTYGEVLTAVRTQGFASLEEVEAVVVETEGTVTVMGKSTLEARGSALRNVKGKPDGSADSRPEGS